MEGMLSWYFLTVSRHPFTSAAVAWPTVCNPFIWAQESAHDLVRLVSCFVLSSLPRYCSRTLYIRSFSIVSLRNGQLSLFPFSSRLTSCERLPTCFLCILQSVSLKLLGFLLLFYFLLFAWALNSVIGCSLTKVAFCFYNPSLPWFQVLSKPVSPKRFCLWDCSSFCSRAFATVMCFPFTSPHCPSPSWCMDHSNNCKRWLSCRGHRIRAAA